MPELDQLKQTRDAAVLALETARAEAELNALKQTKDGQLLEAWGDLVDPLEWFQDDPAFGRAINPVSRIDDRSGGRTRPIIENEHNLAAVRGTARLLADSVPAAIGVIKNLTNFCIGTGFSYKAISRDQTPTAGVEGLVADVQRVVEEFLEDNDWVGDLERELFVRSRRDGEFFLALYPQSTGRTAARLIEPEQVTEPTDSRALEDWLGVDTPASWTFGIHTEADDVQRVHGYHVRWNNSGSDWDYLTSQMVEHVKLNVDRNIKRGISDFYAVRNHLEGVEKLLRNTREGAAVQAAIAFIREHVPGSTSGQIQSLSTTAATASYQQKTNPGTRTRYISKYEPGTVLDVSGGMQYKPGPLGSAHAPNFIAIEQAVLRAIGTRWCMPEYMISGDASNANYSSTMVAESPFVKACQAEQRFYKSRFRRIIWKAIHNAAEVGRFARWNLDFSALRELVDLHVEAPSVAVRDQLSEAQTSEIESRNGILSKRTWSALSGRDYDIERKNLDAETARMRSDQADRAEHA